MQEYQLAKVIRAQSADSDGSLLAGILEMLQEQNRAMQKQYKSQQQMLVDMIG